MGKAKFELPKQHGTVWAIGHIDHGKTTLAAGGSHDAIPGYNNPFFSFQPIANSHVEYSTTTRHYAHIDCPGRTERIKNLTAGAMQIQGILRRNFSLVAPKA